jgi:hypothetical protein
MASGPRRADRRGSRVRLQVEALAADGAHEPERPRARDDVMGPPREGGRQDAETRGLEERRVGRGEPDHDGRRIGRFDPAHHREACALRRRERRIADRVEGRLHVRGRDRCAVREVIVGAQPEHDRVRIGQVPGRRDLGHPARRRVRARERGMEQIGEPRRVRVRAEAGIEALRLARQCHHQTCRRRRRARAGKHEHEGQHGEMHALPLHVDYSRRRLYDRKASAAARRRG